jgi:hypothetical protein
MRRSLTIARASLAFLLICGCTAQLAPAYDQAVSDGLVSANKDIQALFVAVGTFATKDTYPTRAPAYDHIVAELEAVELQIKTRPIPNSDVLQQANTLLAKSGISGISNDPNLSNYPSARSVADLVKTVQHMQISDRTTGLQPNLVLAYENQANIYLTQAITYENFLKR